MATVMYTIILNVYLKKCITDIKNWMTTNKLKLNGEDIEAIILSDKS